MYQYPYGNAQQLNLDWLMEQWQEVKQSIDGSLQGEIDRVEAAITDLLAARDAAAASAAAAGASANAAAQSAQAAAANAATASAQAAAAATARSNAAQAANNAQTYAANAQTQAAAAQNAAGAAAASASQAAAEASDAHDDALAASGSATNAATSAAGALQNFQLSDAARQAAQAAAQDAEDVLESIPEDYSELSADVVEIKADVAEIETNVEAQFEQETIENVASAYFVNGADNVPIKKLAFNVDVVQSGTGDPTPTNVRPFVGTTSASIKKTGKNLASPQEIFEGVNGYLITTFEGKNVVRITDSPYKAVKPFRFKPNTRYTFSFKAKAVVRPDYESAGVSASRIFNIYYTDGTTQQTIINVADGWKSFVIVSTLDKTIRAIGTNGSEYRIYIYIDINSFMVNEGAIPAPYEEYKSTVYNVAFPVEAGTVYGGYVEINEDKTVKLTITMAIQDLGEKSWSSTTVGSKKIFYSPSALVGGKEATDNNQNNNKVRLSAYTKTTQTNVASMSDKEFEYGNSYFGRAALAIYDVDKAEFTNAEFKSSMVGITAVYELNTTIEYSFTIDDTITTYLEINNFSVDTGDIIQLIYRLMNNTGEKITLVKAIIAPVLENMIADTALVANDFRIINNTLYRITAPVAAGAALTPNTNCTATTIGAVLKTLLT